MDSSPSAEGGQFAAGLENEREGEVVRPRSEGGHAAEDGESGVEKGLADVVPDEGVPPEDGGGGVAFKGGKGVGGRIGGEVGGDDAGGEMGVEEARGEDLLVEEPGVGEGIAVLQESGEGGRGGGEGFCVGFCKGF